MSLESKFDSLPTGVQIPIVLGVGAACLGLYDLAETFDEFKMRVKEESLPRGIIRTLGPAVLLPAVVAAGTYWKTGSLSLAVAAGGVTLVAQGVVRGMCRVTNDELEELYGTPSQQAEFAAKLEAASI